MGKIGSIIAQECGTFVKLMRMKGTFSLAFDFKTGSWRGNAIFLREYVKFVILHN